MTYWCKISQTSTVVGYYKKLLVGANQVGHIVTYVYIHKWIYLHFTYCIQGLFLGLNILGNDVPKR